MLSLSDQKRLKSFLQSKKRKTVQSPRLPGIPVKVLAVTREGWSYKCPVQGNCGFRFDSHKKKHFDRVLQEEFSTPDLKVDENFRSRESFLDYCKRIGATREMVDELCRSRGMFHSSDTPIEELCQVLSIQSIEYDFNGLQKFKHIVDERRSIA